MRLAEDYLQLRSAFPEPAVGEPFRVTLDELAKALYCTPRNARLVVRKMSDLQWVRFVSGRGRGHASELTFFLDGQELAIREAEELVKQGDVQGALVWLSEHANGADARTRFMEWLSRYFGYREEAAQEDRTIETLRLPIYRPIVTLDPANAFYAFDTHMIKQIYATLVQGDAETGRLSPGVAHSWEASEDAAVWTFYLRKGVLFHDGTELAAEDVKYTLLRVRQESNNHRWLCQDIAEIRVESRYVLTIKLRQPNYLFAWYMSHSAASIVPAGSRFADPDRLPVGAGSYRVVKFTPGICVLEAFPAYFMGRGLMDRIEILIVPEASGEFGLRIDPGWLVVQTGEAAKSSLQQWDEHRLLTGCGTLTIHLGKEGILQNVSFRKALVHAVDRRRMVRELGYPHSAPAAGFHMENDPGEEDPFYQPNVAARELKRSGYLGETLKLYTYKRHEPAAFWLQQCYGQIGIRLEVRIVPWAELMKPERIQAADFILFEAVLSEGVLRQIEYFLSQNSFIRSALHPELQADADRHIGQLLREPNPDARRELLRELEAYLAKHYTAVYLTYKEASMLSHPSLQGVKFNPLGWADFKDIWFKNPKIP